MPRTDKIKINKQEIVDIIREVFIRKEDAEYIYEKIHDLVLESLLEGKTINLFGCATLFKEHRSARVLNNAFGEGDLELPAQDVLRCRIYPRLQKEWLMVNDL